MEGGFIDICCITQNTALFVSLLQNLFCIGSTFDILRPPNFVLQKLGLYTPLLKSNTFFLTC